MKYSILILLITFFFSCENDNGQNQQVCPEQVGNFDADLKTTLRLLPRFTTFQITDADLVVLEVYETTNFCLLISNLLIYLEKKIGIQELRPIVFNGIEKYGETIFWEMDDDAVLGSFLLYEDEERVIEITKLTEDTIEGRLTATYITKKNEHPDAIIYTKLPDTLRFENVAFTAKLFERN
jgi:hypothetical protein